MLALEKVELVDSAWVGIETSNSPARGMVTLYLVGLPPRPRITNIIDEAQEHNDVLQLGRPLSHVHLGCSASYDGLNTEAWVEAVLRFLAEGFWCSLEMSATFLPLIGKSGLFRHSKFIPLVRVTVPRKTSLGYNATILITNGEQAWSTSLPGVMQSAASPLPGMGNTTKIPMWKAKK